MLICNVVGARPNFMKIAPIVAELQRRGLPQFLVHTGQHYDTNMSKVFFDELGMPRPDVDLGIGSDSHARQTARVMMAFEDICLERRPDLVMVAGDVNSTLAAALVASKLRIPVAHVEAGLRSFDSTMPEETNRILTDHISDLLFTTETSGDDNLRHEGIAASKIHFVGNCMVDTLLKHVEHAVSRAPWAAFKVVPGAYVLLTLHRPSNVDDRETLTGLLTVINRIAHHLPVVFPIHPRTRRHMEEWKLHPNEAVLLTDPLPYEAFIGLMAKAQVVLTDSGGVQEETTALGVPCLTLRSNTERPVTITSGTNRLVGTDARLIEDSVQQIVAGAWIAGLRPPLWDGRASQRIVDVLDNWSRHCPS